jgi:hypothetical protein
MDPVLIVTDAITDLTATVTGVAPLALGVGISIFGLTFAWKMVKKFAN